MSTYLVFIVAATVLFVAACTVTVVVAKWHGRSPVVYGLAALVAGAVLDVLLQRLAFSDAVTVLGVFLIPTISIVLASRPHKAIRTA